ncbi:MAG: SpoIIE family protein phosphatase, partial [Candidatus Limnocylindria bacterium]
RFLEALRRDAELALLPVIAVTAGDDVESISRWLELGADDHLPRVSSPVMLRARLRAALDRRRLRDAESLTREMAVARSIQQDFLPESLPVTYGVELAAALHPAREVSGDFYDVFTLPPSGTIVMVVGDVCDKGVGAALFMALFRSLIRASADPVGGGAIQMIGGRRTLVRQSLEAATPADLLTRVAGFTNDYIARLHGRTNMFATVFLAALDPTTGYFDYLNAGHEPALVVAPDGSTLALRPTGPALGLLPEQVFATGEGQLARDHCLFAFTDGLVEARNPGGGAFGNARLQAALRASGSSAPDVVRGVVEAVRAFMGAAEPHDDLTLLAATRTIGWPAGMTPTIPLPDPT